MPSLVTVGVKGALPGLPIDESKNPISVLPAKIDVKANTKEALELFSCIDPNPDRNPIPALASSLKSAFASPKISEAFEGLLSAAPDLTNQASGLLSSLTGTATKQLAGGLASAASSLTSSLVGKLPALAATSGKDILAATGNLQATVSSAASLLGDVVGTAIPLTTKLAAALPGFKVPGTPNLATINTSAIQKSLETAGKELAAKTAAALPGAIAGATGALNAAAAALPGALNKAAAALPGAVASATSALSASGAASNPLASAATSTKSALTSLTGAATAAAANATNAIAAAIPDATAVVFGDIQKQLNDTLSSDQLKLEAKAAFSKIADIAKGIKINPGPLSASAATVAKSAISVVGGKASLPGSASSLASAAKATGASLTKTGSALVKSAEGLANKSVKSALSSITDKASKLSSPFAQDLNVDLSKLSADIVGSLNAAVPQVANLVKNLPVDVSTISALSPDQAAQIKEKFAVASLAASGAIKNAIPGSIQTDLNAIAVQAKGLATNALSSVKTSITGAATSAINKAVSSIPGT